jgi:hypothetical protein
MKVSNADFGLGFDNVTNCNLRTSALILGSFSVFASIRVHSRLGFHSRPFAVQIPLCVLCVFVVKFQLLWP